MKALTLHQPWAWLVANHWKEVETRSWYTNYRGTLAIHAGKKRDVDGKILWVSHGIKDGPPTDKIVFESLPFGAIVATCNLVACLPTGDCIKQGERVKKWAQPRLGWTMEQRFGNYAPGRWAWILLDVVPVDTPFPVHGWQKIWDWKVPANLSAEMGFRP